MCVTSADKARARSSSPIIVFPPATLLVLSDYSTHSPSLSIIIAAMPHKKNKAKANRLMDVAKGLTAKVVGIEPKLNTTARASAHDRTIAGADDFFLSSIKIPDIEPETIRRLIGHGLRYRQYVARASPHLVGLSAVSRLYAS